MRLAEWLIFAKARLQALFPLPPRPRGPKGPPRPGLVPQKRTVQRGGKTHEQTYYVSPERAKARGKKKQAPPPPPRDEVPPLLALLEEAARKLEGRAKEAPAPPKREAVEPSPREEAPPLLALIEEAARKMGAPTPKQERRAPSPGQAPKREEGVARPAASREAPQGEERMPERVRRALEEARPALEKARKAWETLQKTAQVLDMPNIAFPESMFTLKPPPPPKEAFRRIMEEALSHPKGYFILPGVKDLASTARGADKVPSPEYVPPHVYNWNAYVRAGDGWKEHLLKTIGQASDAIASAAKKMTRVKDRGRALNLISMLHYQARRLNDALRNYEETMNAMSALELGSPEELAQRVVSEAHSELQSQVAEGEKAVQEAWENLYPRFQKALEHAFGPRHVEAGGPIGGAIRALGEALESPEVRRRPNLRRELAESLYELEKRAREALYWLQHPPKNIMSYADAFRALKNMDLEAGSGVFHSLGGEALEEVRGITSALEGIRLGDLESAALTLAQAKDGLNEWPRQGLDGVKRLFVYLHNLRTRGVPELLEHAGRRGQVEMAKAVVALEGLLRTHRRRAARYHVRG